MIDQTDLQFFNKITHEMYIPECRTQITKGNLMWLLRNLAIRNGDNPNLDFALNLIKKMLEDLSAGDKQ
jgi:hypothetical protein